MEDGSLILKVTGMVSIIIGVVLVWNPELATSKPMPSDTFQSIEKRIWWGAFIGIGILPFFHYQLLPLIPTIAATLSALLLGLLIARLIGIILDGSVTKQWIYVGIEILILIPLVWWYLHLRP